MVEGSLGVIDLGEQPFGGVEMIEFGSGLGCERAGAIEGELCALVMLVNSEDKQEEQRNACRAECRQEEECLPAAARRGRQDAEVGADALPVVLEIGVRGGLGGEDAERVGDRFRELRAGFACLEVAMDFFLVGVFTEVEGHEIFF